MKLGVSTTQQCVSEALWYFGGLGGKAKGIKKLHIGRDKTVTGTSNPA